MACLLGSRLLYKTGIKLRVLCFDGRRQHRLLRARAHYAAARAQPFLAQHSRFQQRGFTSFYVGYWTFIWKSSSQFVLLAEIAGRVANVVYVIANIGISNVSRLFACLEGGLGQLNKCSYLIFSARYRNRVCFT